MAYNTKEIIKDKDGNPISQYYNPDTDSYEPVEGANGANKVLVVNNDLSLIPILDKLSQLTGTVIDEETRKSNELQRIENEDTRQFSEDIRYTNEIERIENEDIRKSNELERIDNEDMRITNENNRKNNETERITAEQARENAESERQSNELIRQQNESIRQSNEDLRIALYNDLLEKVASGYFKGEKGDTGNGLEYMWDGTKLGVRVEGETEYVFVDLRGPQGPAGEIDNLTSQHIEDALGYTPVKSVNNVLADETGNIELDIDMSEIENRIGNVEDDLVAHKAEKATQDGYGHIRLSDIPTPEGIPRGIITMWSGSVNEIPEGWALCDGTNGTPDLRDRFIVGAGNKYGVGDTGGEESVTLTTSQLPSHRHSSGTLSTSSDGSHSHSGSSASAGSHSHGSGTLSTDSAGSHSHTIAYRSYLIEQVEGGKGVYGPGTLSSITSSTSGSHSHTISGSTASGGSHSHTITIGTAGSHSHTVSGYTSYTGSGDSHENRPPYFALAFIMKL